MPGFLDNFAFLSLILLRESAEMGDHRNPLLLPALPTLAARDGQPDALRKYIIPLHPFQSSLILS